MNSDMRPERELDLRARSAVEPKLSSQIYERIFEMIVHGHFKVSMRLPSENALSRQFGASRPVVREALARLRDDGLIASRQGSGSFVVARPHAAVLDFVRVGSLADVQRVFEFRIGIEGAAAELAAGRWQDVDLNEIRSALSELENCITSNLVGTEADSRFHRAVVLATHNGFYLSVLDSLESHITFGMNLARSLSLLRPEARLRMVQQEHEEIAMAIEARDGPGARAAMQSHLEKARKRVFEGEAP